MAYKDKERYKQYHRERYAQDKAPYKERSKKRRIAMRAYVRKLREQACADCHGLFPWFVMEFDHRDPSEKDAPVGRLATSWKKLKAELEKCDVVCANCHRIRTHNRRASIPILAEELD